MNLKRAFSLSGSSVLLPPANEVWGKVIFLHLSVILFTGGCLLPGGCLLEGGACSRRDLVDTPRPRDGYCCGGTHPTGMHSFWPVCLYLVLFAVRDVPTTMECHLSRSKCVDANAACIIDGSNTGNTIATLPSNQDFPEERHQLRVAGGGGGWYQPIRSIQPNFPQKNLG